MPAYRSRTTTHGRNMAGARAFQPAADVDPAALSPAMQARNHAAPGGVAKPASSRAPKRWVWASG